MKRMIVTAFVTSLFAGSLCGSLAPGSEESEHPKVVVMMVDNLGWGELGVYGGSERHIEAWEITMSGYRDRYIQFIEEEMSDRDERRAQR